MKLQRFMDVSQSNDLQTFRQRLVDFSNLLDFEFISAVVVVEGQGGPPQFLTIGNTPEAYVEASRNVDASRRDPVLKRLKHVNVPFIYDQRLYVDAGAGDLWEQQAPFGYKNGVAVGLHRADRKHFLLGVDREATLPQDDEMLSRVLGDLQLLAVHAQDAAIRLLLPPSTEQDRPTLTPREIEVLQWTMEGKSAWAAGQILNISENTVKFHLRNVINKLGVSSKHQAVLRAIDLRLI